MNAEVYQYIALDFPALFSATLVALTCALLGNYLVLRKISLMSDAISHAVLPGIVAAFLLSSSRSPLVVVIGAAIAGIFTTLLIELVKKLGKLDAGTAMGVVFSVLFAIGVLLIEQAAARNIDLDADCLLHGQLETIFWYPPKLWSEFLSLSTFTILPIEVYTSLTTFIVALLFVGIFYKELNLSAFDPALASALGFNANLLHNLLMIFVAIAVVAAFEIVGSILVIAMIICPAATARFYTDRLKTQILLSLNFALIASVSGYFIAAFGPSIFGYTNALNAAGMMTVMAGLILLVSALFAPQYGYFVNLLNKR